MTLKWKDLLNLTPEEPCIEGNLYAQIESTRQTPQGLEVAFKSRGFAGRWLEDAIEKNYPNAEFNDGTNQGRNVFVTFTGDDTKRFLQEREAYLEAQKNRQ